MINKYILNSPKLAEAITVEYTNGILSSILMPVKYPLNLIQYETLIAFIPYHEQVLESSEKLANTGLLVSKEIGANLKIKMFCDFYMKYHEGLKFTATPLDGKRIRPFKVSEELLTHYFTTTNFLFAGKHSIANFCKYYNELVVDFNSVGKSKYPNYWTEKFENSLKTQQEINDFWAHLRGLGLSPHKDRVGKTIDWVKAI